MSEERWDRAREKIPSQIEKIEVGEFGNGRWDLAGDVGFAENEGFEVGKVADGGRNGEVEIGFDDVEFGDSVGFVVAVNRIPVAAVGFGVPRDEEGGAVEVSLDF